jgi:hypothetical protein
MAPPGAISALTLGVSGLRPCLRESPAGSRTGEHDASDDGLRCRSKPRPAGAAGEGHQRRGRIPGGGEARAGRPSSGQHPRSPFSSGFCRRCGRWPRNGTRPPSSPCPSISLTLLDRSSDTALALISPTCGAEGAWSGQVGRVAEEDGVPGCSVKTLLDAIDHGSLPNGQHTGRAEKRCEPGDSLPWRQDWLS